MQKSIVIVAGGSGRRMGSMIPKQFLELAGKPVLLRTLQRFYEYDHSMEIILVLPRDQVRYWDKLCFIYDVQIPHKIAIGGDTRFASVKSGLAFVKRGAITGIHDGVRPLVSSGTIARCYETASLLGSAVPSVQVSESARLIEENGSQPVDREKLRLIQTPQVFRYDLLEIAYRQDFSNDFTDDAAVVEHAGFPIHLVDGNPENVKITTPADLRQAEFLIKEPLLI